MEYIIENWVEIAAAASALVLFFDRLAKLTPTKRDDKAVSKIYRLFAVLGLKVPDRQ